MRWIALIACIAGCSVGGQSPGDDPKPPGDATIGDGQVDAFSFPMWVDAAPGGSGGSNDCRNTVSGVDTGYHNTGRSCFQSCHNHGFTLAGTVYTGTNNNTGYTGATITIRDSASRTIDLVVQANGNFYTSAAIAFPALVMASACPYATKMTAEVANGDCNSAGCHAQQGGPAGQIHLP